MLPRLPLFLREVADKYRENLTDFIPAANPDTLPSFLALKCDHGYHLP